MEKAVIVYKSKYGAAKKYALWLEEMTGYKCIDLEKGLEQKYDGNGMMISYILDDKERTKEIMFEVEKDFEEDIREFEKQQEAEDEEDLEE